MEVKVNNEDIEIVVAVTDIISVVLELPIETTPVENFCDTVDDCLGIEPSNGDPDKYLNQQGNWETITAPSSFIESVDNTATINLSVNSGELTADFASMNISQFTNDSGYLSGVPTLQDVTDAGNTTDNNIQFDDGAGVYFNNGSKVTEGTTNAGLGGNKGVALKCSIDYELKWEAGRLYTLEQDGFTIRELSHNFTFTPTANDDDTKGFVIGSRWILDNGDIYVCSDATTGAAVWVLQVASIPNLQDVTDQGATTTNTITVGDINADYSQILNTAIGTENDVTGTYAYLDNSGNLGLANGSVESNLKNTDVTNSGVVLEFPDKTSGSYTIATTDDLTGGTVTSVDLTMPSAFNVANNPITTSGTINVTGAGTTAQYVRGDGSLGVFPSVGGGGGGTVYYMNGNTNQGTFGGVIMYQLSKSAGTGPAANFTRSTTGTIASFITDVNDPNQLTIPAGIWIVNAYLSESGGGSNHAQIRAIVEKWNGSTITVISTGALEEITNGSTKDLYQFAVTIPTGTTLSATDRIIIQINIANTNGKTVTFYTEDSDLASVSTTFANGISSLNGLTATAQTFTTGTTGTDFNISSSTSIHTFNLPTASATNRGVLSSTDWTTFNNKQNALGFTPEDVANKSTTTTLGTSDTLYPTQNAVKTYVDNANNPLPKLDLFNDFTGYTTQQLGSALTIIDDFGLHTIAGGIWVVGTAENGRTGILNLYSYSNNNPQSNSIWTNPITNGNDTTGTTTFTAEFKLRDNLSAAGKPYTITCGLTSRATNANLKLANGYGVYFDYTHSVNGGRFQCVASNNGSNTALDSGVTAALNTWYKVSIVLTNTQALYYINGVLVRTINTNIPTSAISGAMQLECTTSSFTAIGFAIDYMRIQKTGLSR